VKKENKKGKFGHPALRLKEFLTPKIPLLSKWSTQETNETRVKVPRLNPKPQPY
jgi:hypothetical protein